MDGFNSTESMEIHSGEQESVVDSQQENRYGSDAGDGLESAVGSQQEGGDAESSDAGVGGNTPDGADQGRAEKQTREENAAIRAARLRGRREAELEAAKKADEDIASMGIINPYTGRPFQSRKELREYGQRVREAELADRAKKSGKTVEELREEEEDREFIRKKRQEESRSEQAKKSADERREWMQQDALEFMKKHPGVDIAKLEANEKFRKFAGSRYAKEPLADLYEAYCDLVGAAGAAAVAKAESRSSRSTGGGATGGGALTPLQQRQLDAWNRENPDMAMTAKEFLRR